MKKKIHVIKATLDTAEEIRKSKSKNNFVIGNIATPTYGRVSLGVLISENMKSDESRKLIERIGDNEEGNFLLARFPIDNIDECEIFQNLNLSIEESQIFLDTALKLIGLDQFIINEHKKFKLAA